MYYLNHKKFGKFQKASLIWAPIVALILYFPLIFKWVPGNNANFFIAAIGFAVMPIFILHFPDYLICLPIWWFQRRYILKKSDKSKELISTYKESLLFKHEMLYFQMPGLHKIMIAFARNKGIGIQKAMEEIEHIYWFTFQQKQAQKAAAILLKDHEIAHLYIHFVLKRNNHPLLEKLARKTRIARLYLMLFEAKYQIDQIMLVCQKIPEEKGYRFNDEMVNTLETLYHLLTANNLKDFYLAVESYGVISSLPTEISYFTSTESMASQLKKIKEDLEKIEAIERFETRRSFLNEQKEKIEVLDMTVDEIFYEPFQSIWKKVLEHCSELVAQEIKLLQGSAVLSIDLRNREILTSEENRALYFEIINKGQELASNISIELQAEGPGLLIIGDTIKKLPVIESGTRKEIFFAISAGSPMETTVKGMVTFSDRTREGKQVSFSFPITVLKKGVVFREIRNPYTVGTPLKGDAPLFFGREDAFDFINKNILVSGDHHTIVCHGLRRTGKTSLLYHIEYRGFSDKRLVPINIDMQGIGNEKHLYSTISDAIAEKLSLPAFTHERVEDFGEFKGFLKKIKPGMGEKIIVLMLDEFEAIQTMVEDKRIPKTTFNNIRHLMQHEEKLIFLFCGTHKLEEMSADYWSIFFNTAIYYRLSHLHPKDAVRLIKEPVRGQLTYDDLAVEQILKMTGGQPYLVQLLCRNLVNDLNENKKKNDVVIDDVDDAVEHIIKEREEKFSLHIWDESNWNERLILSSAAEELTLKQWDYIGMDALFDKIKTAGPGIPGQQLMEALEKQVSKEILLEKEMRYCFPVNLLRKWIAGRFPLRKVLASVGQGG
ncbi:MAG: hypothetical protein JSV88_09675 [Candidatus Aminicenantes bacterium]|nr:MAG: hypothetical protein JSV88_09675 [Candidatus Aminicenantes bacterium]